MTLRELQQQTDEWINEYGVRYFNELTNMALLSEEVGELSRLMAREYGEQSFKSSSRPANVKAAIGDEIADIIFVVSCLANQMDIDLTESIGKNFEKKTNRDQKRHHENKKLQKGEK